jgi:hypothetical protein
MFESFVILEFPEPEDSDILFLESSRDTIISHDEAGDISSYREAFENLRTISLHPDGTLSYLADLAKQNSAASPANSKQHHRKGAVHAKDRSFSSYVAQESFFSGRPLR